MGSKEVVQLCALAALFCSVCSLNRAGTKFATVVTENYSDGYGPSMSNLVFTAQALGTTIVTVFGPGPRFPLNLEINSLESKVISLPEIVEVAGTVKSSNTIVIESSKPITVVLLNSKPRTADATVVYPIKEWGVEYFALTPDYVKSSKQFAIINADQPNTVEVDLKGDVRFEGKQYRAGTKLTVSLSKFESFQLQSSDDLSGTRIKSEGPVGVITGHTCSAKNSNCNTLVQQLLPVPQWGTTFIVPPLPYQNNFDLVYVTASQQTNFQIQSGSERKSLALDRGQSTSLQISPQKPLYIHASAGIQVLYFCTGGRVGGQMFDPFLMNILPTDTFCQKYSVQGQEGFTNQAMVVSKTTDISGILFDKKYAVQSLVWTPIPGTEYSWALSDFGSQPIQHVVEHPTAAIGVYSIGKADQNAYGSAAPCYAHSDCPEITDGIQYATLITENYLPGNDPQFNLSISARSAAATQVSINAHMPGFPMCLELEQSRSQVISLPQTLEVQGSVTSSNMIIITSQKPLSSILMNYKTRTADTTIVYPVTDWGNEYYVVTPNYGDLSKLFAVMNLENSNSVDVYLTGKVTFNQKTYIKGSKLTIFLSKYESVQLMSMDDLSGTKIVSTKPVGVIAGHVCSNRNVRCNVLFEQLLPVTRWGSSFIVPPQPYQMKEDYVYVAASQSTNVLIQYGNKKDSKQLNSGEVIQLNIDGSTPLYITASQGIQVMFYSTGGSNDKWGFDTFLMNIVPTNLFCRKYFIQGYDKFENRLLVIAKPSDISEIRFDNQLLLKTVKWAPVKGTEYSWAHIEYGLEEKPHYIEHPKSSFGVYSIGTVLYNGYGSPAPCAIDSVPMDPCDNKQCRTGEKCQAVNGQVTCVPVSKAECIAWGDPHYRTFDGRSFDFQGTCTYTIAKTCGNETLPSFNIEAKNENRGSTRVAYLKHVNVQVYGLMITMAKSENGRVRVNQNMYYLPSTLQDGKVKIYQSGGRAVLETDFGLRLSYDWNHHLTVSVTSTFLGQLCGLCGNYNGDSKDDFVMVDGKEANNAASFGRSWKVKDDDPACWDDCKGECKTCESSLISKYQGEQFCGLLAKVDGPFRDCHAVIKPELFMDGCVYDVCLNDGFSVFLCQALKTYADACQAGGVEVYNWRKQSQCPLTCPPNSHYESCGSACPASCSNPSASVNCKLPCTETCQCNDGFVLSAGECVPVKKCGCTYQDRYYPPGVRLWSDNNCEQSCICNAGTGKVQCRNTKCKSFEVCKVVKGVRGCYSNRKATCRASGDPHYISFDGRKFDFQGTCFYQLAAVCNPIDELEKFQVQVQNEHRGNKAVAYTRLVQVNVYGHIIIVSTDHAGKVQVDNLWENLPLSLEDNRLSIQSKGWKAVIETGFGLQVTFDWKSQVEITVPESYAGAMCGLCGNYNQDGKDDLTMKNGQLTKVPAEFGASWKTEDIPGCSDQCKGTCPNCDVTQKRQYETNEYCGIITDPTGPFRDCHAKVPPTYFFDDCVFDACLYKGIQSVVCKAISGYVTKCQEAGAQVYKWRTDTFCTPVCPENSHYEMCASGCPSTCASLTTGTQCDALCEEGCQCNEGFILSGVQCVPISQCGCMYSGRYYKAGEMFFPDGLCTSQCTCGASGAVQCQPITCGENEVCKVQNGVQGCHPLGEGKCTASGDPHYTSFDGLKFDFQGTCTYTLAKLLYTNGSLTPFEVQVENESYGNRKVAVTRMVVTKVNGYSITMEQKVQWRVKVNGINTNLPLKLDDGKVSVIQQGKNIILQTEFGLKVLYDSVYYVQVTVPGNYRNKVGGLCGNFNGNKKDEFALQGGGLTENVNAFGASWNIFVEGAKCNHGCDQDCPRCDETKKAKYSTADSCGIISSTTGPFAACRSIISPDIYFENCVFDVCATDGLRDILCRNLEAYTAACQDAGVIIKPWRNDGFCPMTCPKNSQYEVCADTCRSACAGIIAPLTCTSQCYEGCQCDPGFVFDGEQCVSSGNCGCSHNGRYMKVGESLMSADCSRKCTCNPKGAVSCETIQCTTGCAVQNGAQICLDELVDLCKKKQCRNGETCQQVDNQAVCLPLSKAECIAWGDPHYRTFDRRSFDFQGTCTYTIAKTCGNETLPSFNIEAKNENRGSTRVAYLKHVNVQVYGLTITMAKSENGRVRVNQNMYYLPSTLQDGKVKIYQSGGRAVLETDFGLRLSYDWNHHLTVSVTSTFLGQLCGLCGNYNGDSKDDFVMVDGKEANNAASFGRSWKVKDDDPACWDDCKGECKTCESSLISKYQGEQFCGLLAKVDGPFRDCHAVIKPELFMDGCVYDVCLNDGFSVFLCQALKTYADACQAGGVEVYNWRKQSQCPLTCPPNSHYESCGSACPASCSNPSASVNCKLPCTETCQCNDGFVLSAGECVPIKKCGCTYQDRYYPPGVRLWSDNSCEQSCICDAGTGKVQCRNTKCKSFEVCKVVKGVRGCYSNRKATCRASGDPHYISFDGRKFDFQGTCFYQLAAVCNATDELEKFQVQVQNEHRGNKAVAYTRLVQVNVYGHIIIVSTDHAGKVQVDNLWENLPLSLEDNRLSIQSKGWKAVIETGFGLQVTFDWKSQVEITVPESYAGAMCGLCGNYNQDDKDDLTMKNGQLTKVPAEFGASWKTEDIPGCSDQCKGTCPNCDVTQKRQYETNEYCGIITDPTGPFRDCHAKVPPTYFFDDCVFDACLYKGIQSVVCKAISGYVTKCQEAGAQVYKWRTDTFCTPVCPENSHYEMCASGCPSTCASLTTGTQCDALCEEGCQCNEGFILSGVQCVPISQCGCMYSGRYYKAGEMFFPDGLCTSQCTCGASGAVQCQPITCGENEVCKVQNGVQGCHPLGEGKCTASGDPHYTSFDGLKFDFQGTCTYTLAKLLYTNGSLTPFEVQVENESYGNRKVAVTRMVVTKVNGYSITMEQKVQWRVKVNGINTNLPLKLDDGKVSVIQQGKNIILQTEFGLKVLYDSVYYVQVTVPGNYRNKVGGLCGNFNGNKKDEFALQGGGLTENVNAFGASWNIFVEGAKCNHGCDQDCPRCDETKKAKYSTADSCGIISSTTGPFAACHSVISPDIYFENCVFDVCATDGLRDILCRNLEAYTAACQDAGVIIKPWRNDGFCPMTCPKNSQYEVCADTCRSACAGIIAPLTCTSQCYEGCQCDPGFVFDGEQCVSSGNCGCSHNGRYMKVGESLMSADCSRKCTCNPKGAVSCETIQCTTGCAVQNGAQICLDELVDPCTSKQCRNGETCQKVDNQAVCLPLSKAECIAWGDPHYRTFDGRSFDFQGTCTYTIAKTCGDKTLPDFNIEAKNENRGNTRVAYLKHVNVQVYGLTITMAKSENGRVRVNQNVFFLPGSLQDGKVKLYQSGGLLVLETDFGLRLSYDWNHYLTVSVTSTFLNQLCGLCGNYNGDSKDDFIMGDGEEADNAVSFGRSWKVKDDDPACWDNCIGECKTCEPSLISKYQGEEFCGLLAKADGPFRDCHAVIKPELFMDGCVYDVCLNDGFSVFLCQALKTYADVCQAAGVKVYNWRNQSQCPLTCPPNSHYESCGSACPASCSNTSTSVNCKLPCTETCQCNDGFVLSAGECVPVTKCGCTYQDRYYPPGVRLWSDNNCEQSCICDTGTGKVQCRNTKCKSFEVCKVVKGVRGCYSNRKATCSASGDPHYISFDGSKFDFQGTCFYQLAAVCNATDEQEKFQVQVQNEHRGNKAVAYTRLVQVNVYGHIIIVSTDHAGKVQVDNLWVNLPLSLENNRLSIQEKGWSAIIQTGFGLQVAFNWHSRVAVTVPESYAGAMCGLCGNYNQDSKDDLTMKNGQLTKVPAEFGASWKTEDIPGCSDQCKGTCPNCDVTQKRQYETNEYCGIITDPTGPFRDCHAKVPRTNFFDDCVFDACLYKGMQSVVCKAISGYVTECQQAGAQVYEWRTDTFCTPDCPKNSHYEVCASGCPSTCASLTTGTQCDALCEEGCQCNEGFILSGVQCVPISQCGCMYSGRYYKAGEMFFPDGLCTSQCTCGASGAVQCQPITCGENEVCKVQNGVQGCHPLGEGKCTASGDPHYTSFDGLKFDFQGTCTYTLAKLLYTNSSLTPFEVQVENESYGNRKVAVTRMVVTKVNGYSITMEQKVQWKVKVNGINTNLPLKLDDGKVSVIQQGKNIILQTEFGLKVLYDSVYYVQVTIPGNYRNKVGGLCGNFNGNKKDEFALQGGGLTENVNAFGASWQVFVEGAKCNHGCDQDCPRCDETKKAKYSTADSCGIISSTTGPFAACRSIISPDIYFENCVFDVCATDGLRDILCRNLEAYTAACQDAGVIIKPWRNDGFCPMTCPKNSQYEVCADTCGSACASIITPLTCTSQCYEGCQCDPGFVFDGEQCVSSGNCGCVHNGRYMKAGESVMSVDCTKKCTCFPKGVVICESISCATGERCLVLDGAQMCQQDIVDLCEKKQCQTGEQCQVVKNTPVCVPESKAECIAWGDPHYRTFDGQLFSFQGTCTYTIAKTCGEDADLPRFNIEAKNENRGSTQVAYLKYFNVQVYGLDITVAKSENGRVRVDQNVYFLPVTLQDGKVKIYQSGNRGVLQTDFGLRLTFDWNHRLAVSVPSAFLGALCGLCGNYNEESKDDFRMPDGQQAKNAVSFGGSWKVEDHDPACRDDCNGECKTCEPSFITKYQGEEFCGLLYKADGPFRDCHAVIKPELFMDGCVYDVCLNDGFRGFLCQALNTYADACQAAGVKVYNWREQSQCPLTCPPNSHYESCGSACPASCSNPSASVNCKLPCTETCQCNDGFVLSAGECVPVKKCGCTYKGRYYPPGVRLWSDSNCEQSCICDTGTGKVQCINTKCKSFEVCKVVKGVRGCYSNKKATCSASGDPHYISFDGRKFDFQGTCFYQLAAVCNATDELEKFQVQVQNEHRGNKAVAYTRLVQVNVYGHIIIVSTDHAGKVQVDNLWVNLPLSLENNRLSIQEKGWSAIIQTGFGLQVAFNWHSRVAVTVPQSYAGAMCGLCGNYNQDDKDDLTMKDGQLTQVPAEFGASWKTEDIPGCSDQCKGTCPNCDATQKRQYETNAYCGIITDPTGPFRDCHAKVPPTYFFDDCVFDACLYKGMKTVVCKAITAYVTDCQEKGAQVYQWRTKTFCPPDCPQNSHYEVCASGCPSTCASLTTGTQCDALCEEGCQCNEGFILSGVQCVPIAQCGCMYSGRYYKAGEMFFPDGLCTSQCTCGASGAVQCQPITCGENEVCKVQNGVQGCHPLGEGKCTASGDPHYTSFDGLKFDFQGTCTYTLAKLLYTNGSLTPFEVQVENESYGNGKVAVTRMVVTKVNGYSITMEQKVQWKVKLNGISTNLPLKLDDGKVSVIQQGKNIILQTEFGLKVLYDSVYYVQVTVPGNYRNKVGGLCGNFNGNKKDEFALQGGGLTENVNAFGASWQVFVEGAKCNHGCDQDCPRCDETNKAKYSTADSCGIISSTTGPFAACHSVISPDIYFENCVFDVCATDGLRDILCRNLEAYTAACQDAGVIIKPWRNDGFCPMTCPVNSLYEVCADTCGSTCASAIAALTCSSKCYEGCQCDSGYVFDGEKCVLLKMCGCVHNGRYMKVGESLVSEDCTEKCKCTVEGYVSCEKISCAPGENCVVQRGIRTCGRTHASCNLLSVGGLTTFDKLMTMLGSNGKYKMITLCDGSQTRFEVTADLNLAAPTPITNAVYFNYEATSIVLKPDLMVLVNGQQVVLPAHVGDISITVSQGTVVIKHSSGIELKYCSFGNVKVTVSESYASRLCGLCGNFNGLIPDDLMMRSSWIATNILAFHTDWKE